MVSTAASIVDSVNTIAEGGKGAFKALSRVILMRGRWQRQKGFDHGECEVVAAT